MNDILRFALIIGALLAVYYLVNKTTVIPNAGSVTIPALPTVLPVNPVVHVPQVAAPTVATPPDSPESVVAHDADHLNWDGLGDSQLEGALSKQYQDLTGEDLLPHNDIAQFAEVYPNGVGQMQNKNFLHAGHHVGINTVGQALKNASHDLRSEPANPQVQVSPWQQSSFQPDLLRRPFTIGECE
jgi:hypothetical protein